MRASANAGGCGRARSCARLWPGREPASDRAPENLTENQRIGGTLSVLKQLAARKSVAAINQEIESRRACNRVLGPATLTSRGWVR